MKWQGRRKSSNVQRGKSGGAPLMFGGGIGDGKNPFSILSIDKWQAIIGKFTGQ